MSSRKISVKPNPSSSGGAPIWKSKDSLKVCRFLGFFRRESDSRIVTTDVDMLEKMSPHATRSDMAKKIPRPWGQWILLDLCFNVILPKVLKDFLGPI